MQVRVTQVVSVLLPQETLVTGWFSRHRLGGIHLTASIVSPYTVPRTTWGSLRPLNVILVPMGVVRAWESIWSWWIDLSGFCFNSQKSQYKSSQLSIQHSRVIKKLQADKY